MHILSVRQNCFLCKNNVANHSEIESKIKRSLTGNFTKEYKEESMKNKAPANATSIIDSLPRDTLNELCITLLCFHYF